MKNFIEFYVKTRHGSMHCIASGVKQAQNAPSSKWKKNTMKNTTTKTSHTKIAHTLVRTNKISFRLLCSEAVCSISTQQLQHTIRCSLIRFLIPLHINRLYLSPYFQFECQSSTRATKMHRSKQNQHPTHWIISICVWVCVCWTCSKFNWII